MRWRIVEGLRKEEERRVRVSLGRRLVEGEEMEAEVVKVWVCGGCCESLSLVEDEEEIEIAMVELRVKREMRREEKRRGFVLLSSLSE